MLNKYILLLEQSKYYFLYCILYLDIRTYSAASIFICTTLLKFIKVVKLIEPYIGIRLKLIVLQ